MREQQTGEQTAIGERIAELEAEVRALRAALEVKSRRLVEDAAAYSDTVDAQRIVIARLQEEVGIRDAEIEGWKQAMEDLKATKTFRSTRRLRSLYGLLRRGLGIGRR